MAGEVQIHSFEQEQQMKPNTGKAPNSWLGSTTLQSPLTPALVSKDSSINQRGL
jgi:hypothetical protein